MPASEILLERSKNSSMPAATDDNDFLTPLRDELAKYRNEMCGIGGMSPRDVFMKLSAWHARAITIRAAVYRSESRRAAAFRTNEVEPFIEACDYQFRVWSRIQATEEAEMRLTRGGV